MMVLPSKSSAHITTTLQGLRCIRPFSRLYGPLARQPEPAPILTDASRLVRPAHFHLFFQISHPERERHFFADGDGCVDVEDGAA